MDQFSDNSNFVGHLRALCICNGYTPPVYEPTAGMDTNNQLIHRFVCRVTVPGNVHQLVTKGEGKFKKVAKSRSAQAMIQFIGQNFQSNITTPSMTMNPLAIDGRQCPIKSPLPDMNYEPHYRENWSPVRLSGSNGSSYGGCMPTAAAISGPVSHNVLADSTADLVRQQLNELLIKNAKLAEDLQSANDIKDIFYQQLAVKEQEVVDLAVELATLRKTNDGLVNDMDELTVRMDKQIVDQRDKFSGQLVEANKKIQQLVNKIQSVRVAARQQLDAQSANHRDTNNDIKSLRNQIKDAMKDRDDYRQQLADQLAKSDQQLNDIQTLKGELMANKRQSTTNGKLKDQLATCRSEKHKMVKKMKNIKTNLKSSDKQLKYHKKSSLINQRRVARLSYILRRWDQQMGQNPDQLSGKVHQLNKQELDKLKMMMTRLFDQFETKITDSTDAIFAANDHKNAAIKRIINKNADKITVNLPDNRVQCPECPITYSGTAYLDKHFEKVHSSVPMVTSQVVDININDMTDDEDNDITDDN